MKRKKDNKNNSLGAHTELYSETGDNILHHFTQMLMGHTSLSSTKVFYNMSSKTIDLTVDIDVNMKHSRGFNNEKKKRS